MSLILFSLQINKYRFSEKNKYHDAKTEIRFIYIHVFSTSAIFNLYSILPHPCLPNFSHHSQTMAEIHSTSAFSEKLFLKEFFKKKLHILYLVLSLISLSRSCQPETPWFLKRCMKICNESKCRTEIADFNLGKSCYPINDDSTVYGIDEECDDGETEDHELDGYTENGCLNTFVRGQKWICDKMKNEEKIRKRTDFCNGSCFYYRIGQEYTKNSGWDCTKKYGDTKGEGKGESREGKKKKVKKMCLQTDDYYYDGN